MQVFQETQNIICPKFIRESNDAQCHDNKLLHYMYSNRAR